MGYLDQVTSGKVNQPFLGIVYGGPGVGKTTLAASLPKPVFMGAENGSSNLDVKRLPTPVTFRDVLGQIHELINAEHDFQTLAIDSLDWIEPLVFESIVSGEGNAKIKNIEDLGFGKGFTKAIDEWRKMIALLVTLREKRKMNIILIAHAKVSLSKDPTVIEDYERYSLKLNDKACALWTEFVDCLFFANFETLTAKDRAGKTKAFGDGARYLYTERRPGFIAKNRFGLPFQLPLDWDTLREHLESSNPEDPETLIHTIKLLIDSVPSEVTKTKMKVALEACKHDSAQLKRLENKITTVTNTQN